MNVLIWTHDFYPAIGGIETQNFYFAKALLGKKHRCIVVTAQTHETLPQHEVHDGIEVVRLPIHYLRDPKRNVADSFKEIKFTLESLSHTFKPDILHVSLYVGSESGAIFLLLHSVFTCPVVFVVHGLSQFKEKMLHIVNRFLECSDHVCCVSHSVYQNLMSNVSQFSNKLSVVYNALPMPVFSAPPLSFSPPVFLCLGRFTYEKCFDVAIQSFSKVLQTFPEAQLKIVGDGPELSALKELVDSYHLNDYVLFYPSVNVAKIYEFINQSTVVLMPSKFEAFGLVALEAAQMARPVIASCVGGLPEVVEDGVTGLLVPPGDIDALAQAMVSLLNNPDWAVELGKNARARASALFSIDNMVSEYEAVYEQCKQQYDQRHYCSV